MINTSGWKILCAQLIIVVLVLHIFPSQANAVSKQATQKQFAAWLQDDLWPDAKKRGISRKVFTRHLVGMKLQWDLPDLVPPGSKPPKKRKQSQSEFRSPAPYFAEKRMQRLSAKGQELAKQWSGTLKKLERKYGVPGSILLAIWAKESGYGRAKMTHVTMPVLATKAFMSTRKKLFRKELLALLEIMQKDMFSKHALRSSWAGAMGQPQFMPSTYLKYAVDFDGDGQSDIWNSVPDTLASIANYLARYGWQKGRDWGFEVRFRPGVFCGQEGPDRAQPIAKWEKQGISRISGRAFPKHELPAKGMMLVPAGIFGPRFIVTPNFYVLKEYNNSDLYALYIGNLADRIAYGSGSFRANWGDVGRLLRSDVRNMQLALEKLGYDVGGADGLPGFKTRRSIGEWEKKKGISPSCYPTAKLVSKLR